ncbi:uncharacterized mitochondrial protein AtMg00810-like [Lactuca sativa]|uniref:uncharacterized mitochondrial protein AtMg00810-like n=1 Tax=Lactuca sativa TaxID=4236 RepID=UPI000CD8076F|nr:uncharacterized mitochondrial protein AtMg00810-like [Lactuca sativa]
MAHCNPAHTPVDTEGKLSSSSGELVDDPTIYCRLAGALQYLTFIRPDISYAIQQVCMHMHAPRMSHLHALKHILRYVKGTIEIGIYLHHNSVSTLTACTDTDWVGCPDTHRSTSGYCVFLCDNLISWSAKRETIVSHSSTEAEYRGIVNVVAEICWLINLFLELRHHPIRTSLAYFDNVGAIYMSENPIQH